MTNKPNTLFVSGLAAMILACSYSSPSYAKGGGSDGGGGNIYRGQLVDTLPVTITRLKAYQQVTAPIIERMKKAVPGFGKAASRDWWKYPEGIRDGSRR